MNKSKKILEKLKKGEISRDQIKVYLTPIGKLVAFGEYLLREREGYKYCECKDWEGNQPKIDMALVIARNHHFKDEIKIFNYCPYCGNKLIEKK